MSDTTSRAQTPGMLQDEDSLMSMPSSYGQNGADEKSELLKILEEVSCSSSSDESEEEEISEWREGEMEIEGKRVRGREREQSLEVIFIAIIVCIIVQGFPQNKTQTGCSMIFMSI